MLFKSKRDMWLGVFIWSTCLFMIWAMLVEKHLVMYIIGVLTIGFLLWLWFGTYYILEAQKLIVRSGPLKTRIPITSIKKLRATKTLLSGPALSMHRIEIQYNKYDLTIVSPKNRIAFIKALQAQNQTIIIDKCLIDEMEIENKL